MTQPASGLTNVTDAGWKLGGTAAGCVADAAGAAVVGVT